MAEGKPFTYFITITLIFFALAVLVPFVKVALSDTDISSSDVSALETVFEGSNYLTIAINILFMFFWTFGLSAAFNLYVLLPLRIIALISAYYVIFPTK